VCLFCVGRDKAGNGVFASEDRNSFSDTFSGKKFSHFRQKNSLYRVKENIMAAYTSGFTCKNTVASLFFSHAEKTHFVELFSSLYTAITVSKTAPPW
jgi:molybdenum cofactor biosynthesis enzyme MoaA